jgi:hypothetical protein
MGYKIARVKYSAGAKAETPHWQRTREKVKRTRESDAQVDRRASADATPFPVSLFP